MKYTNKTIFGVWFTVVLISCSVPAWCDESAQLQAEMDELSLFMDADQLVEAATRNPKPISQVAENVTIITAKQIEAMNAHTVAEVLNRVPGIIMDSSYTDFTSSSTIFIHGSNYEHVLVLVDGMRWGYVSFDYPETLTIPVQIIKRIEVIKGAASSTWGSSLGGVVNIITKDTGTDTTPTGTLFGSYGEWNSTDLRADGAGQIGPLSYYLYAGYQNSDGLRDTRFFENQSLYGKVTLPLPGDMQLQASGGYSAPDNKYYYLSEYDDEGVTNDRAVHTTLNFSAPLGDTFSLNLAGYWFEDTFTDNWQTISTGIPYNKLEYRGKARGVNGRLVWNSDMQTVVLGAEFEHRENTSADLLAPYTAPTTSEEVWAVFINDTIRLNKLTITPGLRYDNLSITDDEVSPSIGLTYEVNDTTLLRGNISKGFRKPYPSLKEGDSYFFVINPQLESETIWSYQVGAETSAIPFLHLKATLFDHQASDVWITDPNTWAKVNDGDYERQGVEITLQTESFYNFSLGANGMYVNMKPDFGQDDAHYVANILLEYNDTKWQAQLFGHYLKLGETEAFYTYEPETGTVIWDAVITRAVQIRESLEADIFVALHNISNEEQYMQSWIPSAPRWLEAGIRLKF